GIDRVIRALGISDLLFIGPALVFGRPLALASALLDGDGVGSAVGEGAGPTGADTRLGSLLVALRAAGEGQRRCKDADNDHDHAAGGDHARRLLADDPAEDALADQPVDERTHHAVL